MEAKLDPSRDQIKFTHENFIESYDVDSKTRLHNYRWPGINSDTSNPPKAVIVYFHGFGSHIGKSVNWSRKYVENGFDVVGFDQKGFGKSEGQRGLIEDRETYFQNALNFYQQVRGYYSQLYPKANLAYINLGYSLGAALSIGTSKLLKDQQLPLTFDAFLYIVPCFKANFSWWSEEQLRKVEELSAQGELSEINFQPFQFKVTEEMLLAPAAPVDPLTFSGPYRARTVSIVRTILDDHQDFIGSIQQPVHISVADEDLAVDLNAIDQFYAKISTNEDLKEKHVYNSAHPVMSGDKLQNEVTTSQLLWLNKILPTLNNFDSKM